MRWRLLATILAAAALGACQPAPNPGVVARVDGQPITLAEFQRACAYLGMGADPVALPQRLRRAVVEQLVQRKLVLAQAERHGITLSPKELSTAEQRLIGTMGEQQFRARLRAQGMDYQSWKKELAAELLERKTIRLVVGAKIRVGLKELAAYYRAHIQQFKRPEQILAQHALLPTKALALELLKRLNSGQPMAQAAKAMGFPLPSGGQPMWLGRGHMPPALERKLFSLRPPTVAGPFKSPYGWHVVRVLAKRPARTLSLAEAAPQIRRELEERKLTQATRKWLAQLRSSAQIWYNSTFLRTGKPNP